MGLVDTRGFDFGRGVTAEAQQFTGLLGQGQQVQAQELALSQQRGQLDREAQIRQLLGQTQQPTAQQPQLGGQQAGQLPALLSEEDLIAQARRIDPALANQQIKELGLDDPTRRAEASRFASQLQSVPFEQRANMINARAQSLQSQGRDPKDTIQLLDMDEAQQNEAITGIQLLDLTTKERFAVRADKDKAVRGPLASAGQREFEALTGKLTPEQKKEAALIKLGLSPRAVGSAVQTITDKGIAEEIGKTEATIAQRKKFGELTGSSRAKAIDKGFERVVKIDKGIANIDRAIKLLEGGAATGAIQKFLPSFRAASVELKQVQNEMALDVIGGVTLGAISEAELDLVKLVALPEGLSPTELIQHLQDRKAAQQKIKSYFQEQIDFIDQGGTVAGFLRSKERTTESTINTQTATIEELQAEAARLKGQ